MVGLSSRCALSPPAVEKLKFLIFISHWDQNRSGSFLQCRTAFACPALIHICMSEIIALKCLLA